MAFTLHKSDQKRVDHAKEGIDIERQNLEAAITAYNEAVSDATADLSNTVDLYNEKLAVAHQLVNDIHTDLSRKFEAKSDKFKNSSRGEITKEWVDTFETALEELEPVCLEAAEDLTLADIISMDHFEVVDELISSPDYDE